MKDLISELKRNLVESVQKNGAGGILLSGGLDSAILASLGSKLKAITVNFKSYGEDLLFAPSVASFLNLERYHRRVELDEAIEAIPEVIKILKTFDPAIPNDLVVYFGLKLAKELGIESIMTGDGSDELFAGYSFMKDLNDLESYIRRISQNMRFSSNIIGDFFGIKTVQPFLNREFTNFALSISTDLKIKKENGRYWGKWILRKTFEGLLPDEVIWQDKRPLEIGSGMEKIREVVSFKITDDEFKENSCTVKFINKEHLYYYKMYRKVVGDIPEPKPGEKRCPGCGAGMELSAFHCKICGYTLDWRI